MPLFLLSLPVIKVYSKLPIIRIFPMILDSTPSAHLSPGHRLADCNMEKIFEAGDEVRSGDSRGAGKAAANGV